MSTTIHVGTAVKGPQEKRRFVMDWSAHLEANRYLANSAWSSSNGALVIDSSGMVEGNTSTYVVVTGGVVGQSYVLTNTVHSTHEGVTEIWQRSGRVDVRAV